MDIYDITLHQSWISAIEAGVMRHRLQTESACPRDIWLRRAHAIVCDVSRLARAKPMSN
jgi:hypothetical protein